MAPVVRHVEKATADLVGVDEFLAGPERPGVLLIDGEVFVNDATHRHQRLCARVFRALDRWIDSPEGHGEVGWGGNWVMGPATVLKPDVWWMATGPGDGARYDGPPDLAVEVLSPGTRHLDLGRKGDRYREAGLPELWLVDHRNEMVVVRQFATDDDAELVPGDVLTSTQLPGFELAIDALFAGA
ncbi:MAG: Uma2 family endonuclease [Acidimicrobiia bacterium]|nr:Uma2 family endonuclease [Acidimicrobiia bacterium]